MNPVSSWEEYRSRFGILSAAEQDMPFDRAANFMGFFFALMHEASLQLSINEHGLLLSSDRIQVKKEQEKEFYDETSCVIGTLKKIINTLPVPFASRIQLKEVVKKEIHVLTAAHLFLKAYNFQFFPFLPKLSINPFKLNPRFYELGTKEWTYQEFNVVVFISGSLIFSQAGIGLKILLHNLNTPFAEASFYEWDNCLTVIDINSLVPKDSVTNKYVFIEMITHVIFNIWEMQKNENLALFYRVSHISSAGLGFNLDHVEDADNYKQQINYKWKESLPHFSYFERILTLTFPIVPENSL